MSDIIENTNEYVASTYNRFDIALVSGSGSRCKDEGGKEYIDFTSGIGVNSLGFCDEAWTQAVISQAKKLNHTSNLYYTQPGANLAKELCERTNYKSVFFANSGAEANECAIKLARKRSFEKYGEDRNKIITLVNSFHGRTMATISATGQDSFHKYFDPFLEGFIYVPANDKKALAQALEDGGVCGVMFELIQGEGGVIPLDMEYVKWAEKVCKEKDITFIVDEVQTGIGRTGTLLVSKQFGVHPDITTLAKGLGGGLPIGACLMKDTCSGVLKPGDHATTYGMNPIVCAGANAVLNEVTKELLLEVKEKEKIIRKKLKDLDEVKSIDGMGLMLGISLKKKQVISALKKCNELGLLVLTAKDKIRLLPPLNISLEDLKRGLDILSEALK